MSEPIQLSSDLDLGWTWTENKLRAAMLVAADELTDEAIAAEAGVTRITLDRWKRQPEFREKVQAILQEFQQAVLKIGIASKAERLAGYDERRRKLYAVLQARAEEALAFARKRGGKLEAPGMDTGLIVRTFKSIRSGDGTKAVPEYSVDNALLRELLALEKQAAQEVGQWQERHAHELSGPGGAAIQIHEEIFGFDRLSDDQLRQRLAEAADGPSAGELPKAS